MKNFTSKIRTKVGKKSLQLSTDKVMVKWLFSLMYVGAGQATRNACNYIFCCLMICDAPTTVPINDRNDFVFAKHPYSSISSPSALVYSSLKFPNQLLHHQLYRFHTRIVNYFENKQNPIC